MDKNLNYTKYVLKKTDTDLSSFTSDDVDEVLNCEMQCNPDF